MNESNFVPKSIFQKCQKTGGVEHLFVHNQTKGQNTTITHYNIEICNEKNYFFLLGIKAKPPNYIRKYEKITQIPIFQQRMDKVLHS